jgi:ElaB/YqjD/DUF883 family membrane-anchored ribosome-binding protein
LPTSSDGRNWGVAVAVGLGAGVGFLIGLLVSRR